MNTSAKLPVRRGKRRTLAERLKAAQEAERKLAARLEAEQAKEEARVQKEEQRRAAERDRQDKALESLQRKTQRVQKYEAKGKERERKLDTRKKIIAGALALEHMMFDGIYALRLKALIDEYVTRDQDRALFDLEPLPDDDQRRINPPRIY